MKPSDLKRLRKRDYYCLHCGEDREEFLVPHHRRNRQAGGSKLLDRLDNIILICAYYNGAMESNPVVAENSRRFGHKLASWQDFSTPVYDECSGEWYQLDTQGGRTLVDAPDEPLI